MGRAKRIALAAVGLVVGLVALLALLWFLGIIGAPSAGVEDVGDWGNVSEDRTEVKTTLWVNNPNPFGLRTGTLEADYAIALNGVRVAEGQREGVAIESGNQTKVVTTDLLNDRLPAWWVEYVRANETVEATATGTVTADVGPGASHEIERERTMLSDSTPVITALSKAANGTEGGYPEAAPVVEVRRGWASWGSVNESTTIVRFHFRVHNPTAAPLPADPEGVSARVRMNDVTMLETRGREFGLGNLGRDAVIAPGETREVVIRVAMDNRKVDEWFTSHVRRGEVTDVEVRLGLSFASPLGTETVEVPTTAYGCRMQTAILVDDQETATDCGAGPGGALGSESSTDPGGADGSSTDGTTNGGATDDGGSTDDASGGTTTDDGLVGGTTDVVGTAPVNTTGLPRQSPRAGTGIPPSLPLAVAAGAALGLAGLRARRRD